MAYRVALGNDKWSSLTNWGTVTNVPTLSAGLSAITLSTTNVYSAVFTAPNTANRSVGALINVSQYGQGTGAMTATLQEYNGATWNDTTATASIPLNNICRCAYFYFQWGISYKFTTTNAGYYRIRFQRTGSATQDITALCDSGNSLPCFFAVDDRTGAMGATDDAIICGINGTTKVTVTLDGTQSWGSGQNKQTALTYCQTIGFGLCLGFKGVLQADTAANVSATIAGNVIQCPYSEFYVGTQASPYPKIFTWTWNMTASGDYNWYYLNLAVFSVYGSYLNSTTYSTKYASGIGTAGNPLITADNVSWSVGDEIMVTGTGNAAGNWGETEKFKITGVNSAKSYVIQGTNLYELLNPGFELAGLSGWTQSVGNGTITDETVLTHAGSGHAAKLVAGSSLNTLVYQNCNTSYVNSGIAYTLDFWTRGDGTYAGQYGIYDVTNGAWIVAVGTTGVTSATYTEVLKTFTTPANCRQIRIYFYCPSTNGGTAYFDDMSVYNQGLAFSHTTNAYIVNLTRNITFTTNNYFWTQTFYFTPNDYTIDQNHISGTPTGAPFIGHDSINIQWARFNYVSKTNAATSNFYGLFFGGFLFPSHSSLAGIVSYAGNYMSMYMYATAPQKTPLNVTDLTIAMQQSTGSYGLYQAGRFINVTNGFALKLSSNTVSVYGTDCNFSNLKIISNSSSDGIYIYGFGCIFQNCEIDSCYYGILIGNSASCQINNCSFGVNGYNNPGDIGMTSYGVYSDTIFNNCIFNSPLSFNPSYWPLQLQGASASTKIKFANWNNVANDNRWYTSGAGFRSTGPGLADTTVHTPGGYALRWEAWTANNPASYSFAIPTGNIQTYPVTISCWVNINAAAFYSGTYILPTLTVNYDNGTTVSAVALPQTGWQKLSVSFTPATTYGQLTVTLSSLTDQTGANSYIYLDDFALAYPSGYAVNLGRLDVWANAMPITPTSDTTGPLSIVWTDDPYVLDSEATSQMFSGISVDYIAKLIHVTQNHTVTELYEYCKASARANGVLYAFSTKDGNNFYLSGGWSLSVDGCILSGIGRKIWQAGTDIVFPNGGSTTAIYTAAAGTYVPISVTGIVPGSRLQIYDTTTSTELFNAIVPGSSATYTFLYTGSSDSIRLRLMYVNGAAIAYQWYTATGTVTITGLSINVAQIENTVYEAANIDGSTVTECSVSGTTIRIYVNSPTNAIIAQRIYNWYQYLLFTQTGIANQDGAYVTAVDVTHYTFANTMKIINQNIANPLNITGANIIPVSGAASNIFDLTNGASICLNFNRVEGFPYSIGSGLSTQQDSNLTTVLNNVAAIKTTVNQIPTTPAPTTSQITQAIMSAVVEGTLTLQQALMLCSDVFAGKSNGGGTPNINFRNLADTKNRISKQVDIFGNTTSVTLDLS